MTDDERLSALKIDLGIVATEYDSRLTSYLKTAKEEIEREGATLDLASDIAENNLVIDYAAWMWRKRDTGEGMPRMVRYALNNLILSQKGGSDE